jgi:serine protease Do
MKKIISTVLIAALGGASALVIDKSFLDEKGHTTLSYVETAAPTKHVNLITGPAPEGSVSFVKAAETSVNSVVHIKTIGEEKQVPSNDPFYNFFYGQRKPQIQQGSGSGVIISADGYIVTNNHVVEGADKIEVVLNDKRSYEGELIGNDPTTDLALIKIKEKDLPAIPYGNSDMVKVGEWVLAVGNPFNLTSTVTAGIVSAKGRNINILENDPSKGMFPIESFIQTDAAVNPGNSGGALVNSNGELIGINSAIASNTGSFTGYSFAIPVNMAKKIVADLVEFGTVQRAFIGVSIRDIDSRFAKDKGIKNMNGIYVNGLTDGGSAEEAGIKIGDVITKINENPVRNVAELQEQIGRYRPGAKVNVTLERGGKMDLVEVVLKNKDGNVGVIKKEESNLAEATTLGADFEIAPREECKKLNIDGGLKIKDLRAGKLALAGVKEGFIITAIDNKKVNNEDDLASILKTKRGGTLIQGVYPENPGKTYYYGIGL